MKAQLGALPRYHFPMRYDGGFSVPYDAEKRYPLGEITRRLVREIPKRQKSGESELCARITNCDGSAYAGIKPQCPV